MDENNHNVLLVESPTSTPTVPLDLKDDLISEPKSAVSNPNIHLDINCENTPTSELEDEMPNEQTIDHVEEPETNLITDTVTEESPNNDMLIDDNAEADTFQDTEPDTNVSLNDSNLVDGSVPENENITAPNQKTEKISQFPLGRIRDIMKADPDIKVVSAECVFLVAKATEMFLQRLGKEIHTVTLRNKKKTLQKKDLDSAISENAAFEFLEGALN